MSASKPGKELSYGDGREELVLSGHSEDSLKVGSISEYFPQQ
jgi:hypothetical protein